MMKNRARTSKSDSMGKSRTLQRRWLDLTVTGLSLPLLAPVFLMIALAIKLTSRGPMLYKVDHIGKNKNRFKLFRFRTQYIDTPHPTPVGRILIRLRLTRLPEVLNVLRGDMSLVGPHSKSPRHINFYDSVQLQLLTARPGIISPAQLYYWGVKKPLTKADRVHIMNLELAYLQHRTIWTDLSLLLQANAIAVAGRKRLNVVLALRNRHFFMVDILAIILIPTIALTLRLDGFVWWPHFKGALLLFVVAALLVKIPIYYSLGLYNRYWSYASINDLTMVLAAVGFSTTIITAIFIGGYDALKQYGLEIYRTVPIIDGLLTAAAVGGSRFCLRGLYYWQYRCQNVLGGRRVLIVGAGEAGITAVREMRANPQLQMAPIAFVDDDPEKVGALIEGLVVLGTGQDIPALVKQHQIQQIVIAIPSAPLRKQQQIIAICEQTGSPTDSLPGVYELLAGNKTISPMPKIDFNHLLHREPVEIDQAEVAACLNGATVLVTGAGGSIGSELCRQLARFDPKEIILLGHGENSIFEIRMNLRLSFPDLTTHSTIVDVRNQQRVNWVVEKYRPDTIFHAAAHKHVPFMEDCVEEAVTNNVLGTWNVLRAAQQYDVERFVLISTDKAINPVNIMGVTKRIAELLVLAAAQRTQHAYKAVRFGNVLGSRGSVVPIFQQQIAAGGPLTVTHPEMSRYFMTIPEAAQLVLQAAALGHSGEIFVLDMGEPVRILDLATDLIRLSGFTPDRDIKIVYSGIRPGEKLVEKLFMKGETHQRTKHKKIFVTKNGKPIDADVLELSVSKLIDLAQDMQSQDIIEQIRAIVPEYRVPSTPSNQDGAAKKRQSELHALPYLYYNSRGSHPPRR